jgi:hypothetical protein
MRTFELKDGPVTLTLDERGAVSRGGTAAGTWTTNRDNQVIVTAADGSQRAIDVGWRFDGNNHLRIDQRGTDVFDLNGDAATQPAFRLDRAVLFVKPDGAQPFEFALRPTWNLTADHDLTMTVNGKTSTIDGVISDNKSAFRFNFVDKLEVIEKFSLVFAGAWHNEPTGDHPGAVVYDYEIADSPAPGRFALPNPLVVDNNFNVLAYRYDKGTRTRSVQLVGQFQLNSQAELSYAIERRDSADGPSTTLAFDVDVTGATSSGKLTFALKKRDGAHASTSLTIGGNYGARFKNGVLMLTFAFQQQTIAGSGTARELSFAGEVQHNGGVNFAWILSIANSTTTIALAATDLKLGAVTGDTKVVVRLQGGEVRSVDAMFGFSF